MSDELPARRKIIHRKDGSRLEYSIPEGVADEQAAAEVARMRRAIALGYTRPQRFHDGGLRVNVKWFVRQPRWAQQVVLRVQQWSRARRVPLRLWDAGLFWLKCRWLDFYWAVRGPAAQSRRLQKAPAHD